VLCSKQPLEQHGQQVALSVSGFCVVPVYYCGGDCTCLTVGAASCVLILLFIAPAVHLQVLSNSSVSSGVGVYWMFYSGGDFEAVPAPPGLPGAAAGDAVEGLRMRPGLAMSQVRVKLEQ
jgi:hypothetical protein